MTRMGSGFIVIEDEPDGICEMCGNEDDIRPYGPDHPTEDRPMNVCFPCGMKTPEIAMERFCGRVEAAMLGIPDDISDVI